MLKISGNVLAATVLVTCMTCPGPRGASATEGSVASRTSVEVRRGQTMSGILNAQGLRPNALLRALRRVDEAWRLERLQPGQRLEFQRDDDGGLRTITLRPGGEQVFHFARTDDGFSVQRETLTYERRITSARGTITSSLYNAARDAGLDNRIILSLAGVFEWDLDLARDLRVGDRFSVVHEELYRDGRKVGNGHILAAELVSRRRRIRAVRYQDPSARIAYYTPEGVSVQRAFLRAPMEFAHVSSRFSRNRRHPVLHAIRAHRGTDYAAPTGTPIRATGDGRIVHIGRKGGFGKTIVLAHGGQYTTLYAHMLRFAKGLRTGARVTQRQVIGYVGSSGLASGPHLHYEFRVRGVAHDSLAVELPLGAPVRDAYREDFIARTRPLSARLDLLDGVRLAAAD